MRTMRNGQKLQKIDCKSIQLFNFQSGCFYEPEFLSPLSKQLLRAMLQVVPERRISVKKLLEHDWLNHKYTQPVKWNTIYDVAHFLYFLNYISIFYYRKTLSIVTWLGWCQSTMDLSRQTKWLKRSKNGILITWRRLITLYCTGRGMEWKLFFRWFEIRPILLHRYGVKLPCVDLRTDFLQRFQKY